MVGKKIKFPGLFLSILIFLSACGLKKQKEFEPRIIRDASYILITKENDLFNRHIDPLTARLTSGELLAFLRKIKPSAGTSIHYFVSGNKIRSAAILPLQDSTGFISGNNFVYQGKNYYTPQNNKGFFYTFFDDFILLTDNKILMEKLLRNLPADFIEQPKKQRIKDLSNPEASGLWIFFPAHTPDRGFLPVDQTFLMKYSGDTYIWDLENAGDKHYPGVAVSLDSTRTLAEVFGKVSPFSTGLPAYIRKNEKYFTLLNFDSFKIFAKYWLDFKAFAGYTNRITETDKFSTLKAIAMVDNNPPYIVTHFSDEPAASKKLQPVTVYNDVEIFQTPDSLFPGYFFYPLAPLKSFPYVILFDNYWVWTSTAEQAKNLIRNINTRQTLDTDKEFGQARNNLLDEYQILVRRNHSFLALGMAGDILFADYLINANDKEISPLVTGEKSPAPSRWKKLLSQKIPSGFQIPPRWIYNHRSRKYEIIFQDRLNRLTLMDATGKIKWQKNINEPITSRIYQVDMFKNGKRQFLFSTAKRIYLIDILGNYVEPFPLKKNLTSPVAVFDYDNNRKYRLAFAEENRFVLYDIHGKPVKGFQHVGLSSPLQFAPQHLRIGNKDYIFLQETDGTLHIVNRRGKPRIRITEKFHVKRPWQVYKKHFANITTDGKIILIDRKGKISRLPGLEKTEDAVFAGNYFLAIANKHLYLNGKETGKPSRYVQPGVLIQGNRIYFTVIDKNYKQVKIFDARNGKEITLPGDNQAELLVKKGNKMYLLTRYLQDEIIIYQN
jgi:hypothetical protein